MQVYLDDGGWWWPTGRLRWRSGGEPNLNSFSSTCPVAVARDTGRRCTATCRASSPSDGIASDRRPCSCLSRCCGTPWNYAASPPNCWAPSVKRGIVSQAAWSPATRSVLEAFPRACGLVRLSEFKNAERELFSRSRPFQLESIGPFQDGDVSSFFIGIVRQNDFLI